jgi:hypothetical protein
MWIGWIVDSGDSGSMFLAFVKKVDYGNLVSGRPNLIITGQNDDKTEQIGNLFYISLPHKYE